MSYMKFYCMLIGGYMSKNIPKKVINRLLIC